MGTLPAVELLCQALNEQDGILDTRPGRRLQGTAFAPEIQVTQTANSDHRTLHSLSFRVQGQGCSLSCACVYIGERWNVGLLASSPHQHGTSVKCA